MDTIEDLIDRADAADVDAEPQVLDAFAEVLAKIAEG